MGKKGRWFSAVKKALGHKSKEKKNQHPKTEKSKKKWFQKQESMDVISFLEQSPLDIFSTAIEDVKQIEVENERSTHANPVAATQPVVEDVDLPSISRFSGKSKEEIAAIKIQTAFRGYMARRALRALKRLARLKSLVQGQSVKRQVASTLKSMQTVAHVQSEIRARRIRMSEENQALQRQLQQKREKEFAKSRASMDEQWDDSTRSKAQIEAKLLNKQEAAIRRERALAYAYSHQQTWKNSSKNLTPTLMDPNNPHWGWSWLQRWMAVRPWEAQSTIDYQDPVSLKSAESRVKSSGNHASVGDVSKVYARRDQNLLNQPSPWTPTGQKSSQLHSRQPPSTSKALSSSSGKKKITSARPRVSSWGGNGNDDSRSTPSVKSEYYQRHSIAGSSVKDDDSLVSLPSAPSYLTPTKAAKGRSRLSKSVTEKKGAMDLLSSSSETDKKGIMEKRSASSVKKRISFTASPARTRTRRHSSPPIMDVSSVAPPLTLKDTKVGSRDSGFIGKKGGKK